MSIIRTIGQTAGKSAAIAWKGTRLASTEFAQGAREGYAVKAAELDARRAEVLARAPAVLIQSKLVAH